jgi:DNA-binding SARP family transcriptional activator/energy-coupling factor transporter ATP-binding protein EcfA2
VLGTLSLGRDGQPLTAFKSDKGRALLVYLAVEADRAHRRERLAGLLWPDWPDRDALARLSDTLFNLRRILGDQEAARPFLSISPNTIQLDPTGDYELDLRDFERFTQPPAVGSTATGEITALEQAVARYPGPFLEGFSLKDSAPFEEWALLKREQMARRVAAALARLAALYESRGDYEAGQRHALRLVQLEPLDEESYRLAMRALAAGGKRSVALALYERCRRLLAAEFGVEPDRETSALRDAIRTGRLAPTVRPALAARPSPVPSAPPGGFAVSPSDPAAHPRFVGREEELAWLRKHLTGSRAGHGRVVFVTGEAGSGKSALLAELARRAMTDDPELVVASGSCNALVGIGDPYLPFRDILALLAGDIEARRAGKSITADGAHRLRAALPHFVRALVEHAPDLLDGYVSAAPLLARIETLSPEQGGARSAYDSTAQLVEFAGVLAAVAARQPLLLLINDLQWADGESLSLLFHLGRRLDHSRVLLACSYRPDEVELGREGGRHPLERVVNELEREHGNLRLELPAAPGRAFVDALLDSEPNALPESFREALTCRTGGHPLFTVELLRGLQDRGDLVHDAQGRWTPSAALDWDHLPSRIGAALAERIDRLPAACRGLLEVASVEGEEFTAEIAARVLGMGEDEAARWFGGLLRRQRLVRSVSLGRLDGRRVSRYRFTHYVLRQYLYSRLDSLDLKRLHEAVGRELATLYGEQAPETAVQLAWHFEQAGLADEAADALLAAGEHAMRLAAYHEAAVHLERGLRLQAALPPSEDRLRRGSALRVRLTAALSATRGWGAVERQVALQDTAAEGAADATPLRAVLGLIARGDFLLAQGDIAAAIQNGDDAFARALAAGDRQALMLAHGLLGVSHYAAANLAVARRHLEEVIRLYSPAADAQLSAVLGFSPAVLVLAWLTPTLWILGNPDQAAAASERGLRLAEELGQPLGRATIVIQGLLWRALAGLPGDYGPDIADLLRIGQEQGWPTIHTGAEFLQAWWSAQTGDVEAGVRQMQARLAGWELPGNIVRLPVCSAIFAGVCAAHGRVAEGLAQVDAMLAWCARGWGRLVEPELHRLRGALLPAEAEGCYERAIELARSGDARAWELRAAVSLARLWQSRGRAAEARDLLAGVCAAFTEGFDTPDLASAGALLAELSADTPAHTARPMIMRADEPTAASDPP